MSTTHRRALSLAALLLCFTPVAPAQDEQFREREVLDPQTDEWIEQAPETQPATGQDLAELRALLAQGQYREARKQLRRWLRANPDHERYYEADLLLGDAYFGLKDYWRAYERYDGVADNTSGELFDQALRRSMDVARAFLAGEKRIVWRIFRLPAYDDGLQILDRVYERAPGTRLGEIALRLKADYQFNRGDMDAAQDEYQAIAREYPAGRFIQRAMLRSAEAAEASFPGIRYDARALSEAAERYRQFQAAFPQAAERENVAQRLDGIRAKRAAKDYDIARWYERVRQKGAAEFYYRQILKDWPETPSAVDARLRLRALGVEVTESQEPQP